MVVMPLVFMTTNVPIPLVAPFVSTTNVPLQLATLDVLSNLIVMETVIVHFVQQEFVLQYVMEPALSTVTVVVSLMDVDHASTVFANHLPVVLNAYLVLIILVMVLMDAPTVIQPPILQILVPLVNHVTPIALSIMIVTKLELVLSVPMVFASVIMLDVELLASLVMMDPVLPLLAPFAILNKEILAPKVILVDLLAH